MASTACFLLEADELGSLAAEELWELWRLLGVRGFTSVSDTRWSAGPADELEVSLTRRRDLPIGVDRPRFDELRIVTTSQEHGAAWRFFARDLPAVGRLCSAQLIWVGDPPEDIVVHRPLRSGVLPLIEVELLAVPTGSPLASALERLGAVTHDSGFAVLRRS